ncbi:MAG: hypothetical protein KDD50_03380 [Bdellovibrionales bacterium]|nr:hypothetical protein [Bdellovibrionales bacterium]
MKFLIIASILFITPSVFAKKKVFRKTQSVDFEGANVDGESRTPYGAYLLQKKGIKFMPLYKVRKRFDEEIKNSVDLLR